MNNELCEFPGCERPATTVIDGHAFCGDPDHRSNQPEVPLVTCAVAGHAFCGDPDHRSNQPEVPLVTCAVAGCDYPVINARPSTAGGRADHQHHSDGLGEGNEMISSKTQPMMPDREKERGISDLQRHLYGLRENLAGALRTAGRDGNGAVIKNLEGEIADVEAQLRKLRPPTAGEQLAALAPMIADTEAELRQLGERKSAAIAADMRREPEAAAALERIEEQIGDATGRLDELRRRQVGLQQSIGADRAADHRRAAEAKPLRLAELHHERIALAQTVTDAAHTLVAALRGMDANGAAQVALLGEQSARFLSTPAFRWRSNNALARAFAINPNAPLTAANSLFGVASEAMGAQALWTLVEWEQQGLDDLVPFFATEAEAEAAQQRLERRGTRTIVVPLHGAFTLVPHEHVFGDEASARRVAMRSPVPMAVVAHERGFALLSARFVEAA